jgi:pyrroline-5-carboxylate reductase
MATTVAIVRDAGARFSIADTWPRAGDGAADLVVSPPAPLDEVGRHAEVVILEVSDGGLAETLRALRPAVRAGTAIVTTSKVVPLSVVRSLLGQGSTLFRMVIPFGIEAGEGVAAIAPESSTAAEAVERVSAALAWVGAVGVVSEDALDAVAALSLGGAAFLCEALQGLEDGAVRDGLPRDTARAFAHHTLLATGLLLRDPAGSPADLKDQVASPGGTTIAALASLEDAGVRGACIRAVQRAAAEVRRRRDAVRSGMVE